MSKSEQFENAIEKALAFGEDNVELAEASLDKVKRRLNMREERYDSNMSIINRIFKHNLNKTAAAVCTLAVVIAFSVSVIQPVRAFTREGIDNIKTLVYDIFRSSDGTYVAVEVPYAEPQKPVTKNTDVEAARSDSKRLEEYLSKNTMPSSLEGGYVFSNQGYSRYDTGSGSILAISSASGDFSTLPWDDTQAVSKWYRKGNSSILLSLSTVDIPFVTDSKGETLKGDNQKEIKIGNRTVIYAEYPGARFPIVEDCEDRTQKPDIKVLHTLKWEHSGIYYTLYNFEGDLSLDVLKDAAESVIENLK